MDTVFLALKLMAALAAPGMDCRDVQIGTDVASLCFEPDGRTAFVADVTHANGDKSYYDAKGRVVDRVNAADVAAYEASNF